MLSTDSQIHMLIFIQHLRVHLNNCGMDRASVCTALEKATSDLTIAISCCDPHGLSDPKVTAGLTCSKVISLLAQETEPLTRWDEKGVTLETVQAALLACEDALPVTGLSR